MRTIPPFIEKVASTKNINVPGFIGAENSFPLLNAISARDSFCVDTRIAQQLGNVGSVIYAGTKYDSLLAFNIVYVGVDDKIIPLWNEQLTLQILRVILDTVDSDIGKVNIGFDANTTDGGKDTSFYSGFKIHFVSDILEKLKHVFAITALGRSRQAEDKLGMEVSKDFLVGICRSVMTFIYDDVVKSIWIEI